MLYDGRKKEQAIDTHSLISNGLILSSHGKVTFGGGIANSILLLFLIQISSITLSMGVSSTSAPYGNAVQ